MTNNEIQIRAILYLLPTEWEFLKEKFGVEKAQDIYGAALLGKQLTGSCLFDEAVGLYNSIIIKTAFGIPPFECQGLDELAVLLKARYSNTKRHMITQVWHNISPIIATIIFVVVSLGIAFWLAGLTRSACLVEDGGRVRQTTPFRQTAMKEVICGSCTS